MALGKVLEAEAHAAVFAGRDRLHFESQLQVVDVADHRCLPGYSQLAV
jgi:hypothetical protein